MVFAIGECLDLLCRRRRGASEDGGFTTVKSLPGQVCNTAIRLECLICEILKVMMDNPVFFALVWTEDLISEEIVDIKMTIYFCG